MSGRKKILIVDDSVTSISLVKAVLKQLPFDVITAHDGAKALEIAAAEAPDMVLMDVEMPLLNGFEACRRLRQSANPNIPIILVTSRAELSFVRKGFEAGCNGYLTKPVNAEDLLAKVRNYLGGG
jgi:CheY-like chemotaxis protein